MNFKGLFRKRTVLVLSFVIIAFLIIVYVGNKNRTKSIACASINGNNVPIMETIQNNNDYYIILKDLDNIKLSCSKSQYDFIDSKDKIYYIEYETNLFDKSQGKVIIITDKNIMGIPK